MDEIAGTVLENHRNRMNVYTFGWMCVVLYGSVSLSSSPICGLNISTLVANIALWRI